MTANFKSLALTYKFAPLEVREQVSLNELASRQLLHYLRDYASATDLLVVSTCNRTEVYYVSDRDLSEDIFRGLRLIKQPADGFEQYFSHFEGEAAVRHLFHVAIGLDAQVLGDLQISGQIKNAYQWSAEEGVAGPFLHRLMHTVFFANKRIVQETAFRDGAASLSYAAKELAEDLTAGRKNAVALVVGVGEIGQDVCLNLKDSSFASVTIINRTVDKAEKLAQKCDFSFKSIESLRDEICKADVIISSVSGNEPLISRDLLDGVGLHSHKFFIDLSIPRSIDPSLEEIPGVILYNLDEIQEKTNATVEKRRAAIPHVERIIEESMTEFEEWSREMIISPTIQKLKNALEQIRREELARFLKNARPEEAARMEELSRSMMQKILKYPVLQLKAACKRGEAESLSEMLNELFNLEKQSQKSH